MNSTVGDLSGNAKKIISFIRRARKVNADIVAFPELAVTGYPPEDLLMKPHFIHDNIDAMDKITEASKDITAVVGFVDQNNGIYNAAGVISDGRLVDVYQMCITKRFCLITACLMNTGISGWVTDILCTISGE
jgi:NAD+ synthase (glutamine-hydrolysing)